LITLQDRRSPALREQRGERRRDILAAKARSRHEGETLA
jgi:hypothetical protein